MGQGAFSSARAQELNYFSYNSSKVMTDNYGDMYENYEICWFYSSNNYVTIDANRHLVKYEITFDAEGSFTKTEVTPAAWAALGTFIVLS